MIKENSHLIELQLDRINVLKRSILAAPSLVKKIAILDQDPKINRFVKNHPVLDQYLHKSSPEIQFLYKALIAIGQDHLFQNLELLTDTESRFKDFTEKLSDLEQFYEPIGGLLGYHTAFLQLLLEQSNPPKNNPESLKYYKPEGVHIDETTSEVLKAIRWGIEGLPLIGEIYPVGGAGDRLHLLEESTGKPKPVGHLPLFGKNLITLMIHDIQAREFLYYKLFGKQVTTPIAMMTSEEKDNHSLIKDSCKELGWFGRPKDSFYFFMQPLVPVITEEGQWALSEPLKLYLKPGGHGALWKLARDKGVIQWLENQNRFKVIVRQVNNPAAGIDHGLLALAGIGLHENKSMGFASCHRRLKAPEGMDILIEKKEGSDFYYGITNIEYTDFAKNGIEDVPEEKGGKYSIFPSNTNILFVDLEAAEEALKQCPIPGVLINLKTSCPKAMCTDKSEEVKGGRLESMMQNIADGMMEKYSHQLSAAEQKKLKTFVTYNSRSKTIVTAKKAYVPGESLNDTPPGAFYELQGNHADLLSNICGIKMPPFGTEKDYVENGPGFVIHLDRTLGPLYAVIGQKIQKGVVAPKSEMQLDISEIEIKNIDLDGSLRVFATDILGHRNSKHEIVYSSRNGKCTLRNVKIRNKGIDRTADNTYWKFDLKRAESLYIHISGSGEFYAEDVVFQGNMEIKVPDGTKVIAYNENGKVLLKKEKISAPTWEWKYHFDENDQVILKRDP